MPINAIEPEIDAKEDARASERSFGLVFAAIFALIGGWPLIRSGAPHWTLVGIAVLFALLALAAPATLRPLNALWHRLGLMLHAVVSPLVMGLVFFCCVTPIGIVMRLRGKDILSLRRRSDLKSYWIVRSPPGPEPTSMTNQF